MPTFVAAAGGPDLNHILEGRSLLALTRGGEESTPWRDHVVSELDYSFRAARLHLNLPPERCRAYMIRNNDWKYVLFEGFRPQLFDLNADPREIEDRGADPALAGIREDLHQKLFDWARNRKARITLSNEAVAKRTNSHRNRGTIIGEW